jgi:DNA polymerase III subunit delta'
MPSIPSSTTDIFSSRPVQVMMSALERGRLSHSLIISGDQQDQVEEVGRHLAQAVLDSGSDVTRPLDRHPDFLSIRPTGKMRQISADNTRDLVRQIHHSPNLGTRKAAILYEAERLHTTSANIFLKTLEEPPASTTIILLTTRPQYLLPTIRSRCLHFRLPVVAHSETFSEPVMQWLADYTTWLEGLPGQISSKQDICQRVMQLYGLLARFSPLIKSAVSEAWKTQKAQLPDNLAEDEEAALAEGFRLELRDRLFGAVEYRLRAFALSQMRDHPGLVRPFTRTVDELERVAALLRVNLNETAALETFLLETLRLWARRQ